MAKIIDTRTDTQVVRKGKGRVFPVVVGIAVICFLSWDQSSLHLARHALGKTGGAVVGYSLIIIAITCFVIAVVRRRR
jgi:hypothetical protein